jgi:hypothetical protein
MVANWVAEKVGLLEFYWVENLVVKTELVTVAQ